MSRRSEAALAGTPWSEPGTTSERTDRVGLVPASQQPQNVDSAVHREQAALFRAGLALLPDAPPGRRAALPELTEADC